MASQQNESREELDEKARHGLEAQEHLAEGRSRGGQTRKEQMGKEGYQEMGRKGGLSTTDKSGEERAEEALRLTSPSTRPNPRPSSTYHYQV